MEALNKQLEEMEKMQGLSKEAQQRIKEIEISDHGSASASDKDDESDGEEENIYTKPQELIVSSNSFSKMLLKLILTSILMISITPRVPKGNGLYHVANRNSSSLMIRNWKNSESASANWMMMVHKALVLMNLKSHSLH